MKFRYLGYDEWDGFFGTNDIDVAQKLANGDFVVIDCIQGQFILEDGQWGDAIQEFKREDLE